MIDSDGIYVTRSKAKVIDNIDPLNLGRLIVNSPLTGDTTWIPYLKLPNFYDVPSIGDIVYVEADCGSENHLIAWGNVIVGSGSDVKVPEVFRRKNPTNRGFYSPGGHLIELDDGDGIAKTGKGIRVTTSSGIKLNLNDSDGLVNIETGIGDIVLKGPTFSFTGSKDGDISIVGPVGEATIGKDGAISIKNAAGSLVITPTGQLELKGTAGGLVELLQEFAQTLATDTFAGFGAPAGQVVKYAEIATKLGLLKA